MSQFVQETYTTTAKYWQIKLVGKETQSADQMWKTEEAHNMLNPRPKERLYYEPNKELHLMEKESK